MGEPNDVRGSSGGDEPLPEDGVRRDVRASRHDDLGVEIRRDLTSQGRLARGSGTNMSRLSFRVGAVPRQERDPELELREAALRRDAGEPRDADRAELGRAHDEQAILALIPLVDGAIEPRAGSRRIGAWIAAQK